MENFMLLIGENFYEENLMENSLVINEQVNERSTCSFSLKTDFYQTIEKGMPLAFYGDYDINSPVGIKIWFLGIVNDVTYKDYYNQNTRIYKVNCIDLHQLIDKRIWSRGFVNETCGEIIRTMYSEILEEEGLTLGTIEEGYNIPAISFSYKKCSSILDQLAEIAGCVWYVDRYARLHFVNPLNHQESKVINDSDVKEGSMSIKNKNNQYRNKQYIKGANAVTNTINQNFKGDGSTQTFTLGYRLSEKPKIYVNGVYVLEDDIVLKGYNESAKWYYEKNDAVILQNPAHTPLKTTDTLKVEYQGIYPIVAISDSKAEIQRLYGLGMGTGIIEECDTETEINDLATAISTAVGRLSKYCGDSYQVSFVTRSEGFEVGQRIDFNVDELKDKDYIIEKIDITDDINTMWYKISAVKGALCDSWTKAFGNGLLHKPTMALQDVSETETVVLNHSFTKTWILANNPNIFKMLFPNDSLMPSNSIYPSFNEDERISFIEIVDNTGAVLSRNIKSIQTDPSKTNITTYFYIDPYQAVGQWAKVRFYGGHSATFEHGSGVMIEECTLNLSKSQLEGVQISRLDIKGW